MGGPGIKWQTLAKIAAAVVIMTVIAMAVALW